MTNEKKYLTLHQDSATATRDLLVGRRIVGAEMGDFEVPRNSFWRDKAAGKLTLDDETEIFVIPNEGGCCCGAGDYFLEKLATVDNAITDVRLEAERANPDDKWGEYGPTSYRIYVIADNVEINAVQIDGDDGNGYYGTGYELVVVPAE